MTFKLPQFFAILSTFFLSLNVASAQWTFVDLPLATNQHSIAAHGDSIFIIAGNDPNDAGTTDIQIYNTNSETWGKDMQLSKGRNFSAAVATDKALYVAGGLPAWQDTIVGISEVEIYNFSSDSFTTYDLGVPFYQAEIFSLGSKIVIVGGITKAQRNLSGLLQMNKYIFIYDETTSTWSKDSLEVPRHSMGVASNDSLIIMAGGFLGIGQGTSNRVDIYNVRSNSWSHDTLSQNRSGLSGVHANGKFYFAGGVVEKLDTSDVIDIFDGKKWSTGKMPVGAYKPQTAVMGDYIYYVAGGISDIDKFVYTEVYSILQRYNTKTGAWTTSELAFPRVNHRVLAWQNKIFIAGGFVEGTSVKVMEILDPSLLSRVRPELRGISVSPNPSSGIINISGAEEYIGEGMIEIWSTHGQLCFKQELVSDQIDASELEAGVYYLSIKTENGIFVQPQVILD